VNAAPPAAALFTSFVLRGQVRAGERRLLPEVDVVERFLLAWSRWFNDYVVRTDQLHLTYRRTFTLAMPGLLHVPQALRQLSGAVHAAGLAVEATLDATEALAHPAGVDAVLDAVDALYLQVEPGTPPEAAEATRALIARCLAARATTHLLAPPALLRAFGLLRERRYGERYINVFAAPLRAGREIRVPGLATAPCRSHLRLYIDEMGDVYPCAGLFGVAAACMGNVHRAEPEALFASGHALDHVALAQHGPTFGDAADAPRPPFDLCARHREQLAAEAAR
jgi:hypothetical protein